MYRLRDRPRQLEHDIFKKIFAVTELANMTEDKRFEILSKMTTERDLRNQMAYATQVGLEEGREQGLAEGRAKGMAEGRAEGRAVGRTETIRQMLKAGIAMETIANALDLTPEECEALL